MTKPTVLCVDDDPGVLSALRRALRAEVWEVVTATNAAQALASLRHNPVEVIVSDERMPGMDGSEFLAEVRQRWPWIGRVLLTGYPGRSVLSRSLQTGIDFLIQKPWDDLALKATVRDLIGDMERARSDERRDVRGAFDVGGEGGSA